MERGEQDILMVPNHINSSKFVCLEYLNLIFKTQSLNKLMHACHVAAGSLSVYKQQAASAYYMYILVYTSVCRAPSWLCLVCVRRARQSVHTILSLENKQEFQVYGLIKSY